MHLLGMSFPFFYRHAEQRATDTPLQPAFDSKPQPEITWHATDDPGPKQVRSEYFLTDAYGAGQEGY